MNYQFFTNLNYFLKYVKYQLISSYELSAILQLWTINYLITMDFQLFYNYGLSSISQLAMNYQLVYS